MGKNNSKIKSTFNNAVINKEPKICIDTHNKSIDTHNKPMSKSEIDALYSYESSMCKIKYKNEKGENRIGTGFFCEINNKDIPFKKVLFTNNHILDDNTKENNIELSKDIEIEYLNENKKLKMDKNRRKYTNKDLDYICIEIFDEDEIKQFFKIDESYFDNRNQINNKEIIILQYHNGGELKHSLGKILYIENNEIYYNTVTCYDSSGSPLISRYNNNLILGIHRSDIKNKDNKVLFNLAIPFDAIINDIKNKINVNIISNNTIINLIYNKKDNCYNSNYKKKYQNNKSDDKSNNIFGDKFVENNKDNIALIINGKESKLISEFNLNEGRNNIQMIIKNKLTNLEGMFSNCISLENIDELKYLNTKNVNNFSDIFFGCKSLSNIKSLENWNVSNGINFSWIFSHCSSLSDIKPLENWNVSNGNNFSGMFSRCLPLSDIKPLENWNVSNGNDFSGMFFGCLSLSDIKSLENWNVSKGNNFSFIFNGCSSLSDIKSLKKWNVSNGNNFSFIFKGCSSLLDIKPLKNWNVSNNEKDDMFL